MNNLYNNEITQNGIVYHNLLPLISDNNDMIENFIKKLAVSSKIPIDRFYKKEIESIKEIDIYI